MKIKIKNFIEKEIWGTIKYVPAFIYCIWLTYVRK